MVQISKSIIDGIWGIDSFQRVNETHPLDLYIGKDVAARPTLLLISDEEPSRIYSSKLIGVQVGRRNDMRWSLSFSLNDSQFEDVFYHFCDDIINSSKDVRDKTQGALFICNRYVRWQELLRKNASGLLSFSEIKGLIGELLFLKEYMFKRYEKREALLSWIGPDKADQDFVCSDSWYEVKATVSGAEAVKISSVEQLDTTTIGRLVVVYLDKTSSSDSEKVTLNALVEKITGSLLDVEQKKIFEDILLRQGYVPRKEYDEYSFKYSGMKQYIVDDTFPALRRKDIPKPVISANYLISIAGIEIFLQED